MLDRDDGDDFVAELIDELLENVDKIIYANYIESQVVPYTVLQAKDAILQIIEVFYVFYVFYSYLFRAANLYSLLLAFLTFFSIYRQRIVA